MASSFHTKAHAVAGLHQELAVGFGLLVAFANGYDSKGRVNTATAASRMAKAPLEDHMA